jgi:hypothetical protein
VILLGADRIENTVSLLLLPVFVFTKLLPDNALIKSVTLWYMVPNFFCVRVFCHFACDYINIGLWAVELIKLNNINNNNLFYYYCVAVVIILCLSLK